MSRGRHYAEILMALVLWCAGTVTHSLARQWPRLADARRQRRRWAVLQRAYEAEERAMRALGV